MGKHTPGKWVVMSGDKAPRICVDGDKEWPIVVTISGHSDAGIKANERLIAAAPELLEALNSSFNAWGKIFLTTNPDTDLHKLAEKMSNECCRAIAKAQGSDASE